MNSPFFRKLTIFLIILSVLFLPGCWDRKELNNLAIVTAIGIDLLPNNEVELSVQQIVPQPNLGNASGSGGSKKTVVQSGQGKTIIEAKEDLQRKVGRILFWGHAEAVIFSRRLAEKGVQEQIDFLVRYPEFRMRARLFVNEKPKEILRAMPETEPYSVRTLKPLSQLGTQVIVDFNKMIQMLTSESRASFLPWLEVSKPSQIPYINGAAIFKQDRMVDRIDEKETRTILWLHNELETAILAVTVQGKEVGVKLFESKTKLVPLIKKGKWRMLVKIDALDDVYLNKTGISKDPRFTSVVGRTVEKEIESQIKRTIHKLQQKKVDVFGIANSFHRAYPHEWHQVKDNWEDLFPRVEIDVQARVKIRRTGLIDEPVGIPGERKGKVK